MSGYIFPDAKPKCVMAQNMPRSLKHKFYANFSHYLSFIHQTLHPCTNTAFQSTFSPTFGSVHLRGCILLYKCYLFKPSKCETAVHFLNYASLDLLTGKYLACFMFRGPGSIVKSYYHVARHYPDVCSHNQEGIDNSQTGTHVT